MKEAEKLCGKYQNAIICGHYFRKIFNREEFTRGDQLQKMNRFLDAIFRQSFYDFEDSSIGGIQSIYELAS